MKRVKIVGGGIAGQVALNELSNHPVYTHLDEASDRSNGRIYTVKIDGIPVEMGASFILDKYYGLLQLAKEMGLEKKRYPDEAVGYLKDGDVIRVPSLKSILSRDGFSLAKMYLSGLKQSWKGGKVLQAYHDSGIDFTDVLKDFPEIEKDYNTSFGEYAASLNPRVRKHLLEPLIKTVLLSGPEEMNMAIGKAVLAAMGSDLYTFDEGLEQLPNALYARNKERISLNSPVTKLERAGNKWGVTTPSGTDEYDYVIWAAPLTKLAQVTGTESKVKYSKGVRTIVRGALKNERHGKVDTLFIGEGDSGVTCLGILGEKKRESLYEVDSLVENPRLGDFFKPGYSEIKKAIWNEAIPKTGRPDEIPRKIASKNLILAGDSLGVPSAEMSTVSGQKAAHYILKNAGLR